MLLKISRLTSTESLMLYVETPALVSLRFLRAQAGSRLLPTLKLAHRM